MPELSASDELPRNPMQEDYFLQQHGSVARIHALWMQPSPSHGKLENGQRKWDACCRKHVDGRGTTARPAQGSAGRDTCHMSTFSDF